jgi:hypothetical protein
MPPQINNITSGDAIHVAWITPDQTCEYAPFEVDDTGETDSGFFLVDITNDQHDVRLVQTPMGPFYLLDQPTSPDDDVLPARAVLGVGPTAGALIWEIQLTLLEMGYSPAEAMDLLALRYSFVCTTGYAQLRGEPQSELQERVDDIIADLAEHAQ